VRPFIAIIGLALSANAWTANTAKIYSRDDLPASVQPWMAFNPLAGIFDLYRAAFFPEELNWVVIGISAGMSVAILGIGALVFSRSLRSVVKEI
jgi:ABC-2 type transport system permease protein